MPGLVLKLTPYERLMINGAVIENGERRGRLSILTPNTNILRLRGALTGEMATTPLRRACFVAQSILTGDIPDKQGRADLLTAIDQVDAASMTAIDDLHHLTAARVAASDLDFYRAMKCLRALLPPADCKTA